MEKIKILLQRILLLLSSIFLLLIPVNANFGVPVARPGLVVGILENNAGNCTMIPFNWNAANISFPAYAVANGGHNYIAVWTSTIEPNSIYKFTITFEGETPLFNHTGMLNKTDFVFTEIVDPDYFKDVYLDSYGISNLFEPDYNLAYSLNNNQYSMFWDVSRKQLSLLFALTEDQLATMGATDRYIMMHVGNNNTSAKITYTIDSWSGISENEDYTDILNQINDKLSGMGGGSGISEEQIESAIEDALSAHDEHLSDIVSDKLDEFLGQFAEVTQPYKDAADQITGAIGNVSNIFASTDFTSTLTLPAAVNPLAANAVLWPAQQIDLSAAYLSLPAAFRNLLQFALRAAVLLAAMKEVVNIIRFAIIGRGE